MKTLKNIEDRKDLADYLNIPIKRLTYILYIKRTENLYYSFEIPKKVAEFEILMLQKVN